MIRRPVMRYHGGKWKLAPWIIQHFPEHRVYVEAFGGAASVLLQKPRAYAEVYNDLDGEICGVFRVLRNPTAARELERVIRLTPFAREEFELSYLADGDPIEQARRTIFRSFAGFGSAAGSGQDTGFRADSNRSGTAPAHDWMHYSDVLPLFCERLQGIVIENRPAAEVMARFDGPQTLHYVDPPYMHETRSQKRRNSPAYRFEMTDNEHRELAAVLHGLQGMVVLSGYPCPLYDELYADWYRVERGAYADGARERVEVLWIAPNAVMQPMLGLEVQRSRVTADAPLFAEVAA
jgi:DNA adenine methylase